MDAAFYGPLDGSKRTFAKPSRARLASNISSGLWSCRLANWLVGPMLQNPKAKGIHPPIQQASTSAALASAAAAVDYYVIHPTSNAGFSHTALGGRSGCTWRFIESIIGESYLISLLILFLLLRTVWIPKSLIETPMSLSHCENSLRLPHLSVKWFSNCPHPYFWFWSG